MINDQAIRGGVPMYWNEAEEFPDEDDDDERLRLVWDMEQPEFGHHFLKDTNVALPEALLYHGMALEDGGHVVDVMECDMGFVRRVVNDVHGVSFGALRTFRLNDEAYGAGAHPLRLMADLLEHLMERGPLDSWHPRVNDWLEQLRVHETLREQ